jgi:hypothetical protein
MRQLPVLMALMLVADMVVFNAASAQVWRDAVITMANGDTLRGQSDFADPDLSVSSVIFRQTSNSPGVTYDVTEVKSFRISNPTQHFERLNAEINYYSTGVVKYGQSPIVARKKIDVFAEVVRASPGISLYSIHDENRDERFFVLKNGELTELQNIAYLVEKGDITFQAKERRFESQLRGLLSDCVGMKKRALSYDARSLGNAVEAYIVCTGEKRIDEQTQPYELITFGVLTAWSMYKYDGEQQEALVIGGAMQVLSRKNRGNQFLWVEAGFDVMKGPENNFQFAARGGSYLGTGRIQPFITAGVGNVGGSFGLGVAYKKRIILSPGLVFPWNDLSTRYLAVKLAVYPRLRYK